MDRTSRTRTLVAALVLLVVTLAGARAQAHQLWIEQDGKGARLFLGERARNLREDSPGMLDKLLQLTVRKLTGAGEEVLTPTRTATSLTIDQKAGKGESIIAEENGFPIFEAKDGARVVRTAWTPAARFVPDLGVRLPVLTLDLVPTGKPGQLQAFFRGKPLAGAEITVLSPSGWVRHAETDAEGKITVSLPWRGTYVIEVEHTEAVPGSRPAGKGVERFDSAMFATTLSFVSKSGPTAPPAPAPAPPSE